MKQIEITTRAKPVVKLPLLQPSFRANLPSVNGPKRKKYVVSQAKLPQLISTTDYLHRRITPPEPTLRFK